MKPNFYFVFIVIINFRLTFDILNAHIYGIYFCFY